MLGMISHGLAQDTLQRFHRDDVSLSYILGACIQKKKVASPNL
jgi:hypothetical protein